MTDRHPRFLVVDGALTGARASRRVLEAEGIRPDDVLEAHTGIEALRAFADHRPPVVLLELDLPDMDGDALVRRLRALDPDAWVVVLTALEPGHPRVRRAIWEGAAHVVGKPLREHLARALARRARQARPRRRGDDAAGDAGAGPGRRRPRRSSSRTREDRANPH